ncbi:PilZ domain-containing protein [Glaciecola sp. MF2-115]|uniref:PilZ domain-containing protein n=1 Tax=Glaciecola sp. MF2-115 TaxID=3384827 RepID=UPI0039A1C8BC
MTNDLSEHTYLIHKLAPFVEKPEFSRLLYDATKDLGNEKRFLLKMEMKRLSKPCIRSIDLRTRVNSRCQLISFQGIKHYLHKPAIELFEDLVERYGIYTFGVYESVLNLAEHEFNQNAGTMTSTEDVVQEHRKSNSEKYIVSNHQLLNYAHRSEERMNYVVLVEIFLHNKQSLFASTVDISPSGLKIKLKDPDELDMVDAFTPVNIVFRGFQTDSGVTKESIEYKVLGISREGEQARVHLCRDLKSGPTVFNNYVNKLIKTHKRKYKVNLDNTVLALDDKIHEQAFASTTPSLSIFVDTKDPTTPTAKLACVNGTNKEIMDYWLDEDDEQYIGFMLNPARLAGMIANSSSETSIWVYAFTHIKNGKVYFYSATSDELEGEPKLKSVFLSYASRKVSWRVYKLVCTDIDPKAAYVPSAMPTGINRKIDRLNRPLTPRLESKLKNIKHMISVTDVTHLVAQQCYQKINLDRDKVKQLAVFGHPRNKPPEPVLSFRFKQEELRKETRYKLRTAVKLENYDTHITGVSEDCSVSGLKIELDSPFEQRINSRVSISFPALQKKTTQFVLEDLKYRVKHINYDQLVLHLEAISEQELSVAEKFFTLLIDNNRDKLKTLTNEESVPGMGHALRCLQARYSPQLCTYMQKQSRGYFPISTTMQPIRASWLNLLKHDMPATKMNTGWLFQDKHKSNAFIRDALRILRIEHRPVQAEIYVAFDPNEPDYEKAIVAQWERELATHRSKLQFIKTARARGEFYAFSVHISRSNRPDTSFLEQEMAYITRYAIHKAKQLEEKMWDISGQIYLTDITQEAIYRYHLNE